MKTQTKNEVKEALVSSHASPKEKFNAVLSKFLGLDEVSSSQKRYYNAAGFSPRNLESLIYDIQKVCGIKDTELITAAQEVNVVIEEVAAPTLFLSEELKAQLHAMDFEKANYNTEIKPLAKAVSEALQEEPISQKKVDLVAFMQEIVNKDKMTSSIESALLVVAVKDVFVNAPEEVKVDLKLRDEFPFLNSKDCPDKFKILVADKLTAYNAYKDNRAEVKNLVATGASETDIYQLAAATVENFELNLEITEELNYYKEHGEILGKHPIFAEDMMNEKVAKMSTIELTKRQKNLRTYVSRDSLKLDKMEEGETKVAFAEKLEDFKTELELIDARLEKIS